MQDLNFERRKAFPSADNLVIRVSAVAQLQTNDKNYEIEKKANMINHNESLTKSFNSIKLKPLKFGETEATFKTSVGVLPLRNR